MSKPSGNSGSGVMERNLLNEIAIDNVMGQAIDDKMEEYKMTENQKESIKEKENKTSNYNLKKDDEDEDEEFGDIDSEEERIMNKQINSRLADQEKNREKEKVRLSRKYGDVRDIVETEFLDIMIKNDKTVCHFYHDQFERCKIMDKHIKQIADLHPETLFVRINAEKTPFFTNKLNVKVI
jgi:hypothetical protein